MLIFSRVFFPASQYNFIVIPFDVNNFDQQLQDTRNQQSIQVILSTYTNSLSKYEFCTCIEYETDVTYAAYSSN